MIKIPALHLRRNGTANGWQPISTSLRCAIFYDMSSFFINMISTSLSFQNSFTSYFAQRMWFLLFIKFDGPLRFHQAYPVIIFLFEFLILKGYLVVGVFFFCQKPCLCKSERKMKKKSTTHITACDTAPK
jgi:hypothetical protein